MDDASFGRVVRRRRRLLDLTQEELAALVGYAASTLRRVEIDDLRPSKELAARLADALGVRVDEQAAFIRLARGLPPIEATGDAPAATVSTEIVSRHRNNLPVQRARFIGRSAEMAMAHRLLRRADVGLLTLTGPGGTGKTRLALQVAAECLADFPDGVFFIDLSPVRDASLVLATIAEALDIRDAGQQRVEDRLQRYVRDKRILLVLDNFEQVLAAVPMVAGLLAVAPELKILLTSRVVLRLREEQELSVPPLEFPNPGDVLTDSDLTEYAAVELFVYHAARVRPDFVLTSETARAVAEICARLDGLPLAIELAAARTKMLPPPALLAHLGSRLDLASGGAWGRQARQQTLRNTLAWSLDLLDEPVRPLFRRLAVLVGGFTTAAAERIGGPIGASTWSFVHHLSALVDHSLVVPMPPAAGEARFRMLETVREYAMEQLEASGEAIAVQRRHVDIFLELVEEGWTQLEGPNQLAWLHRLEVEHDNLRAALAWTRSDPSGGEAGLRLVGALGMFWAFAGYVGEGLAWVESALRHPGAPTVGSTRAWVLFRVGQLSYTRNDAPAGREHMEQAAAMFRTAGDARGEGSALRMLTMWAIAEGRPTPARWLVAESERLLRQAGDRWALAWTAIDRGDIVLLETGEDATARAHFEESAELFREVGDRWLAAVAVSRLGFLDMVRGDYVSARRRFEERLAVHRELGLQSMLAATALAYVGWATYRGGDYARAEEAFTETLAASHKGGSETLTRLLLIWRGYMVLAQGSAEEAKATFREALRRARTDDSRAGVAAALAGVASVFLADGRASAAAQLLGAVEGLLDGVAAQRLLFTQFELERDLAAARTTLGDDEFDALRAQGKALSPDEAFHLAMTG